MHQERVRIVTDRDVLRNWINLQTDGWEEREYSITVFGGPKYMFLADGTIKSVIKDGRSYHPGGLVIEAKTRKAIA
jgi:hypothetical protein